MTPRSASLLLVASAILVLASCKKDVEVPQPKDSMPPSSSPQGPVVSIVDTVRSLKETGGVEGRDSTVQAFVKALEAGAPLRGFLSDRWTFVYHEDNRCEGSTDGKLDSLEPARIDSVIRLGVIKDGEGQLCKKRRESFEMAFDLKKSVKTWDRFEREVSSEPQTDSVWVWGGGSSDYLKLVFGKMGKIVRLEYRSEDPG